MPTMYLVFPSAAAANNASQADWAQRVLKHPVVSTNATKNLWQVISNDAGTIGIIPQSVQDSLSWLSTSEAINLLPATDPTVAAVLARQTALFAR